MYRGGSVEYILQSEVNCSNISIKCVCELVDIVCLEVIAATFRNLVPKLKHKVVLCTSCCVTFLISMYLANSLLKQKYYQRVTLVWALFVHERIIFV